MNTASTSARTVINRRPVQSIFQRHLQRERSMLTVFPPDFVHGAARLDELYDTWGSWAEKVMFVRTVIDQKGRAVSCSVAYFDDWFLTVEHARSLDVDLSAWLLERTQERNTIVEMIEQPTMADQEHHIQICVDESEILALEYEWLHVTREEETSFWESVQTDLLTLVCLTARLGRVA